MFPSTLKTQPAGLVHGFLFAHQSTSDTATLTNANKHISYGKGSWRALNSSFAPRGHGWQDMETQQFCLVQLSILMEVKKLKNYSKRGLNQCEEDTSTAATLHVPMREGKRSAR